MAKATATTRAMGAQMATVGKANTGLMGSLGVSTKFLGAAGIAGALVGSAKAAIDFESSFAGVRKTVDASEAEFAALSQGFRDLSKEIPVNVNELNRIGEAAGQLGIETGSILGFTEVIAKLGVTTNLSVDEAASQLARMANITQMPQEQFSNLGSSIVALGNNFATTEAEITDFALRMAGAGEVVGLTEGDILGIGAAMSSVGVESERGGTAVQKTLLKIDEAVITSNDSLDLLAETAGMSAEQFAAAWKADPSEAFVAFVEGLGKSGKQAQTILKDLGLSDQRLIAAFLSLAGAGDTARSAIDLANSSFEDNIALNEEAAKRFGTTASQIQLAKNAVNDAAISIGDNLTPAIATLATALADVVGFLSDFSERLDLLGDKKNEAGWVDDVFRQAKETLEDTIPGLKFVTDALGASGDEADAVATGFLNLGDVAKTVGDLFGNLAVHVGSLRELATGVDMAGSAVGGFIAAQGEGTGATEAATAAIEAQVMAVKELQGVLSGATGFLDIESAALGVESALLDYKDAQGAVNQLVEDGKKGTREYKRALIGQREAQLGVLTSQADLEESLLSYTEKVESGEVSQRDAIAAVKAFGAAAGLSKGDVQELIDTIKGYDSVLDGLPKEKKTKIEAEGIDKARTAIDGWMVALNAVPRNITTTVSVSGAGAVNRGQFQTQHAGGPAGSGSTRFGSHLRSDEYATILQRGEVTFSKAQVKAMASSPGHVIYVDARGSTLTEAEITRAVEKGIDSRQHRDARFGRATISLAT